MSIRGGIVGAVRRIGLSALCIAAAAGALVGAAEAQMGRRKADPPPKSSEPQKPLDTSAKPDKTYPTKVTWQLKALGQKAVPVSAEITMMIDENFRGTGYGGCNNWSATIYPLNGQKLVSGPIASTKRKCDAAKMQLEHAFLVALHSGGVWDLDGPDLVVKTQAGVLRFFRAL
ncbi:MAG: META domain-containing protein [Rhizobiales bacterium]|nr:META domain-containing protein [Hyphomicrobiales bacterium]